MSRSRPAGGVAAERPLGKAVLSARVWPPPAAVTSQSSANPLRRQIERLHAHVLQAELAETPRCVLFHFLVGFRAGNASPILDAFIARLARNPRNVVHELLHSRTVETGVLLVGGCGSPRPRCALATNPVATMRASTARRPMERWRMATLHKVRIANIGSRGGSTLALPANTPSTLSTLCTQC